MLEKDYRLLCWSYPPTSSSHHGDYSITFLVGNPNPNFHPPLLLGRGTTQLTFAFFKQIMISGQSNIIPKPEFFGHFAGALPCKKPSCEGIRNWSRAYSCPNARSGRTTPYIGIVLPPLITGILRMGI